MPRYEYASLLDQGYDSNFDKPGENDVALAYRRWFIGPDGKATELRNDEYESAILSQFGRTGWELVDVANRYTSIKVTKPITQIYRMEAVLIARTMWLRRDTDEHGDLPALPDGAATADTAPKVTGTW